MIYVISDIHGCFYTLKKLIDKIRKKDESPQFVFVGDYVDRGLNSKRCVRFLIKLQSEGAVCLRGNHDDVVGWLLNGESEDTMPERYGVKPTLLSIGSWWIANGLLPTIESYVDVPPNSDYETILKSFVEAVPGTHKKFFRKLKMHWESDTHFACHAYVDPTTPLPRTLDFLPSSAKRDMLWSRFQKDYMNEGLNCPLPVWDKIGVFGHSPMSYYRAVAPIKHGNLRLIDTGAYHGEYLCAFCIEQDDWTLQSTDSRDITS